MIDDGVDTAGRPDEDVAPEAARSVERRLMLLVAGALVAVVGLSVPLVVALVSRQSSASFADTEVLEANRLGAASIDLEVRASPTSPIGDPTPTGDPEPAGAADPTGVVFAAGNLAPGDTVSGHLELVNAGDFPLRYGLVGVSDGGLLDDWLRFEVWAGSEACAPGQPGPRIVDDVRLATVPVTLIDLAPDAGPGAANVLQPGQSVLWCVGATLPLETPNEAQGQSLEVTLSVPVQQVVEEDR